MTSVVQVNNLYAAQLKRSARRKTIGIKVHKGEMTVSAPMRTPLREIQHFVKQKAGWIEHHLQHQQTLLERKQQLTYGHGELLQVMGVDYPIRLDATKVTGIYGHEFILAEASGSSQKRAVAIANWFTQLAYEQLSRRVLVWADSLGVKPGAIKIRHYKSRWGSCNRRGELQFNWLIMMAPDFIIDYIVIHELAHLKHFNHSPAFWRLVQSVCPQYTVCRAWLRTQTHLVWHID